MSTPRRISKKVKDKSDTTIDIDTFKAWLSGVEDMQGDEWTPSAEQWKKIRSKINLLTATEYEDPKIYPQQPIYRAPGQIGGPNQNWTQPAPVQGPIGSAQGSSLDAQRPNLIERPNLGHQGALPSFQAPGINGGSIQSAPTNQTGEYESTFS